MKKKEQNHLRKLTLNRETIRTLQEMELQEALGAATLQNSCDTVTRWGCSRTGC